MARVPKRQSRYGRSTVHRSSQRGGAAIAFPPGKHQIGFLADSANQYEGFRVADYVDLDLAASGKYVLTGNFEGINLVLHILDVSTSTETVMQELKFKVSSKVNVPPVMIPVPITVHH
jgi:hypothetical protein